MESPLNFDLNFSPSDQEIAVAVGGHSAGGLPPQNISPPVINGYPMPGELLFATVGSWVGSPTSYTRRWSLDGNTIPDQTAEDLEVDDSGAEEGGAIRHHVIATNAFGDSVEISSDPVFVVLTPEGFVAMRQNDGIIFQASNQLPFFTHL